MRPTCSTAYKRRGSAGVDAIAVRADRPRAKGRSDSCCWFADMGTTSAAAARSGAIISTKLPARSRRGSLLYLLLKEDLAKLVFHARLQDGKHLVARLELGRADRDLRLPVAHDRDQPRALRQPELLDGLTRARGALVD